MIVIDGKNAVLGRLASYVAKEALKGEEFRIVNCEQIIITGNRKDIQQDFKERKGRVGSTQKGPKYSITTEKIVKHAIRGMLPNYREGRGREALKRIRCYKGVPGEFEKSKKIELKHGKKIKFVQIGEMAIK